MSASQVAEDAVDDMWFGDERDYAHLLAAAGTREGIDLEDAAQQLGPTAARFAECYDEIVDVVMFRYNHMESRTEPLIAALREKGIGTIAMKTLAGGKHGRLREFINDQLSYPQAAIGWVLANNQIDCAVLSMDTYSLVDAYVSASGQQTQRVDSSLLRKYRELVEHTYCCVTCTSCESSCPHNVAISDVMRCEMYYDDYRQPRKALDNYATLADTNKPTACATCEGFCAGACPYGLAVRDRLLRTHRVLTV